MNLVAARAMPHQQMRSSPVRVKPLRHQADSSRHASTALPPPIESRSIRKPVTTPVRLPPTRPGMRIGLFGGSFNPPHEGHVLVSKIALKRLRLDRIWWLVTPGNPLKDMNGLPEQPARIAMAKALARHPAIEVTGFETDIGTRYTSDTINFLLRRCKGVNFVWLMGADNLAQFHRWQNWADIARKIPIAIIDRPGSTWRTISSKAAQRFVRNRLDESDARILARIGAPAWIFLHGPRSFASSTAIRERGKTVT